MVSATAAACVLARARLETGSIWPCVVLHAAYNSVIQSAFWPSRSVLAAFADDPHRAVGTGSRMAELSRFQTLIAAIDSSRDESSFSS